MNNYSVVISENAQDDLRNLSEVISYEYKAPITAKKYLKGIYSEMHKLSHSAESYKIEIRKSLQHYGPAPRRINYKKMAIVYHVINDVVYIRRVIPSSIIAGL